MGLFSRKTIISVASVIYPMGETGDRIPDVVKASVITAGLQGRSVPNAIKTSILDGVGIKLAQGYNYARTKYYAGMPRGLPANYSLRDNRTLELLIEEHLRRIYPSNVVDVTENSVSYEDDFITVVNNEIAAYWDYDWFENETRSPSGSVQTGASLVVAGPFYDWQGEDGHIDDMRYQLTFTNPDSTIVVIDQWFPQTIFTGHEQRVPRVVANYTLDGSLQQAFSYRYGGDDARLNLFLRQLNAYESGTFPPITLKKNNVYLNDNRFSGSNWKTSAAYRTSKEYGNRMKIDIDEMISVIRDNANEGDIDYAFIQPGIILASPTQIAKKYLFNYFMNLYNVFPNNKPAFDDWRSRALYEHHGVVSKNLAQNCPAQSFRIYDPDNQANSIDMEIAWRYITVETKSGHIDGYQTECGPKEILNAQFQSKTRISEDFDVTKLWIRRPIDDTTYEEICVAGLWHENYVYKGHSVQSAVWDMFNDPDGDFGTGFIIPLDYGIFITLNSRDRLQLAQECFHMVFNCYVARKQKWYETGIFRVVLIIIAAIIIYFSWGTLTEFATSLYAYFSAALIIAVGATLAAAIAVVLTAFVISAIYVGVSFVAKEAGQWAAEHWGAAWGAVVQIATTIILSYGVTQIPGVPAMPAASLPTTVLRTSSFIISGMSAYTEYTYMALQNEIKTWEDYATGPDNPLKQVNDLLQEMFPDLTFTQQAILPHPESMEEFLGRTLTLSDGLTNRLISPIRDMVELTLTPRLP
jgi:uncharacterized membrane protein (DUF485 family)